MADKIPNDKKINICVDCDNAFGGCPWSEKNPETNRTRFEPVPGWTATKAYLSGGRMPNGEKRILETYRITECPLFVPDKNMERRYEQEEKSKSKKTARHKGRLK